MKTSLIVFLLSSIFISDLWAQQEVKLYKNIKVFVDWTLEEKDPVSEVVRGKEPYFSVTKEDGFLTSIEYFDRWNKPAQYMLDPTYHLYFSKAKIEYIKGKGKPKKRITQMTLYNFMGLIVGQIRYKWDNKSIMGRDGNLRNAFLYQYSSTVPIGFIPRERRWFTFSGGGLDLNISQVEHHNLSTTLIFKNEYYNGGNLVREEQFDTYNQKVYTSYYSYSFGKLKNKEVFSKYGVKLTVETPNEN